MIKIAVTTNVSSKMSENNSADIINSISKSDDYDNAWPQTTSKRSSMGKKLKKILGSRSTSKDASNYRFKSTKEHGNYLDSPNTISTALSSSFSKDSFADASEIVEEEKETNSCEQLDQNTEGNGNQMTADLSSASSSVQIHDKLCSTKTLKMGESSMLEGVSPRHSIASAFAKTSNELESAIEVRRNSLHENLLDDNESVLQMTPVSERGLDSSKPITGIDPSTSTSTVAQDASTTLASLSEHYTPTKDTPKYSETEMQATLDAVILEAEKKWMDTKFTQIRVYAKKEAEASLQSQIQELQKEHEKETIFFKNEIKRAKDEYENELQSQIGAEAHSSSKDEQMKIEKFEMMQKIIAYEAQQESDSKKFEIKIKKIVDDHAAEIDELLAQLDLVEEEHSEKVLTLEKNVHEKETIIGVLGTQLSDAIRKNEGMNTELKSFCTELEASQNQIHEARNNVSTLEVTIKEMTKENANNLEEERKKRLNACQKVKSDMISAAEQQFEEANVHYIKLKKEYDSSRNRLATVETELQRTNAQTESLVKQRLADEAEKKAEIAQLKASLAAVEASAAKSEQKHSSIVDKIRTENSEIMAKLEEAKSNCASAHMSLATVVTEKQRLSRENAEINAVCEELMSMVEVQE